MSDTTDASILDYLVAPPGSVVLLSVPDNISPEQAQRIKADATAAAKGRDVTFVVCAWSLRPTLLDPAASLPPLSPQQENPKP